jgi:SOS-response transcriptional repressor LexA
MQGLTTVQREILDYIVACQRCLRTPTFREIAREFGISSPNGVLAHINALTRKGYIDRPPLLSRALRVLDTGRAETLWGDFEIDLPFIPSDQQ